MNNTSASLMVAVYDHTVCLRVSGRADYSCTVDLKSLVTGLCERGYTHYLFDLHDCRMIDSTFSGVLAGLSQQLSGDPSHSQPVELSNVSPRVLDTLENLGITFLFKIGASPEPVPAKFEPHSPDHAATPVELASTCLQAHQILMELNTANFRKFKDVAQFLAEDLKRLQSSQKP